MINPKELPPMKLVRYIKKKYPDFFPFLDQMAARPQEGWDRKRCFVAPGAVLRYVCGYFQCQPAALPAEQLEEVPLLTAAAEWRVCKNVYDFDPSLTEELYRQAKRTITVGQALLHLPAYALYIRPNWQDGEDAASGRDFFVYWDGSHGNDLYFLTMKDMQADCVLSLAMDEADETLDDCIRRSIDIQRARYEAARHTVAGEAYGDVGREAEAAFSAFRKTIARWLTLVLYLTAVNADITPEPSHFFRRTRKVSDIPREVEILNVGRETGIHLRTLRAHHGAHPSIMRGGTHRSPIMHLRRAHWHTYRTGSRKLKKEQRKAILKWIAPVIVNGEGKEMEVVTVERVKR